MKASTSLVCLILGILLMALSGLEKILIYTNFNVQVDVLAMKNITPTYIWYIPNVTFIGGLLLTAIGISLTFSIYNKTKSTRESE
ncbi:hypothetical protein GCM10007216_04470 [Thalassobacillus devorans]|uniref:DUF3955 domain-containing protein n=1 Tax=Thalassobacillus devorans TaxID=279813 RepID=A0ABQ1NH59_9BACI|nr:hypothetical protein [Thalassobacillus devorans]GGC77082.1 hypothetical protein GCM10007216_04470 [Thalassobacillus devorans]